MNEPFGHCRNFIIRAIFGGVGALLMVTVVLTIEIKPERAPGIDHPCAAGDLLARYDAPFVAHIAGLASKPLIIEASKCQLAERAYEMTVHQPTFLSTKKAHEVIVS
jgi:hypothetical protein